MSVVEHFTNAQKFVTSLDGGDFLLDDTALAVQDPETFLFYQRRHQIRMKEGTPKEILQSAYRWLTENATGPWHWKEDFDSPLAQKKYPTPIDEVRKAVQKSKIRPEDEWQGDPDGYEDQALPRLCFDIHLERRCDQRSFVDLFEKWCAYTPDDVKSLYHLAVLNGMLPPLKQNEHFNNWLRENQPWSKDTILLTRAAPKLMSLFIRDEHLEAAFLEKYEYQHDGSGRRMFTYYPSHNAYVGPCIDPETYPEMEKLYHEINKWLDERLFYRYDRTGNTPDDFRTQITARTDEAARKLEEGWGHLLQKRDINRAALKPGQPAHVYDAPYPLFQARIPPRFFMEYLDGEAELPKTLYEMPPPTKFLMDSNHNKTFSL